ncbi:hypothetical protein UM538_09775 [Staphylococcus aureus]|nr:hypothetical protein UM538_09775 [Staphylococcus aureus]
MTFDELLDEKMERKQRNEVKEVLNYLDALNYGYDQIKNKNMPISTNLIKKLHAILLEGTRGKEKDPEILGRYRIL